MRRSAACLAALVFAGLGTSVVAPPAGAATNSITLNLTCQSSTPIGTIATTQTIGFDATAPDTVQAGSTFDVRLDFPAGEVSSSQNGGAAHVDYIKNLSYRVPVPANATYNSGALSGGFNYGAGGPTVTLSGTPTTGTVIYSIPGPIPTDQQFQIPALTLHLSATGAQQSTITTTLGGSSINDPGFTTTAHATSPFNGDAATSCYEPAPKSVWTTTTIIAIDTTPPTITLNTPAEGAQYPQGADVVASYSCDDGALSSGVATCSGDVANGAPIDTSALGTFAFTVHASDNAGNVSSPVMHTYSIVPAGNDFAPPQITITAPANGGVYQQGSSAAAAYACVDGESGIARCDGDVVNGAAIDTSTVGGHTFTVAAVDRQGNPYSVEHGYRVVPGPSQQNFTSGDVANQIPVACDNMFQTLHKTIPVASNTAPTTAAAGGQLNWSVALGSDFIPSLYNGTALAYIFKTPTGGHYVSAATTGPGSQVNGAAIKINGDGTLELDIASVTDQGTLGVGNDNFTPPPFSAVVAVDGAPGSTVKTQLASFAVTATLSTVGIATTSHCTGGDPTFNGRVNPTLTNTSVVDAAPPVITITSPVNGLVAPAGAQVTFNYACSDDRGTPTCVGDVPNGTSVDTSSSGVHELAVTSTDAAGNTSKSWVTFTIDDPAVGVGDVTVVEGPAATLDFPVTLSNPSTRVVTINYATSDGSAGAPTDYVANAGVLTFNPGDPTTKTISVAVNDNQIWTGTRTLSLTLVSAMHASLGDAVASGTIIDDDPPPVSVADAKVTEGPTAVLNFAVSIAADPHSSVEVDYNTVDGTAHAPARYAATSGVLTFDPGGPLVQHVLVPVVNDSVYDETTTNNAQTMFLDAVEVANGNTAVGTGTIVDDEAIPPVVNIGSATIREGDVKTRPAKVVVTLTKPSLQTVMVNYATVAGTANATDFAGKTGLLTFKPGQVFKVVSVSIKGDATPELDESFTVHLSRQVNTLMGNADGTVTVIDDDHPSAADAGVSVSDNSLYEGGGKPTALTFTVSLNRLAPAPVTMQYSLQAGTARSGVDYGVKSGSLSFSTTQLSKAVTIKITTDFVAEPTESFTLVLTNVSGAVVSKGSGTGTILDDD